MKTFGVLATAIALCACNSNMGDHAAGNGAAVGPTEATPVEKDVFQPIACKRDADCPRRACGPCTPGETVVIDAYSRISREFVPHRICERICAAERFCALREFVLGELLLDVTSRQQSAEILQGILAGIL